MKLKNKNGKIVGVDEDGNEVPVELGDAVADSFSTDSSVINNDLTIPSYTDVTSVPTGENAGYLAVTEDGHLVLEDGQ
ncbi:hypothetical protein [Halosimplex halobium]|uniref:hypothetical protein n=1 Tax=Halosimplex halobium TaxID=3396618 RepID=UPI003F550756